MLVTIAAKTIGGLARGLRGKFGTHAPGVCVALPVSTQKSLEFKFHKRKPVMRTWEYIMLIVCLLWVVVLAVCWCTTGKIPGEETDSSHSSERSYRCHLPHSECLLSAFQTETHLCRSSFEVHSMRILTHQLLPLCMCFLIADNPGPYQRIMCGSPGTQDPCRSHGDGLISSSML